jgi:hypothetical protein
MFDDLEMSGGYRKCRVVRNVAARDTLSHRQTHTIFGGYAFHNQLRIVGESETRVIGWIAHQDTSLSAQAENCFDPLPDQFLADSTSLMVWEDPNRTEYGPQAIVPVDLDRRKGDVPHNLAVHFGNE